MTAFAGRGTFRRSASLLAHVVCAVTVVATATSAPGEETPVFARDVAPIFERHCLRCHRDDNRKGDLSLATREELFAAGHVVAGEPASSYLLDLVTSPSTGERPMMPKEGDPLTEAEVDTLRRWIAAGADWSPDAELHERSKVDGSWWSFQPIARSVPPDAAWKDDPPPANAIDRFVAAALAEQGLAPNGPAEKSALIRRVTYDLTGLPPTPDEIDAFLADDRPDAYERLVDRLLASPRYGEHWGRHWLDVARFGESNGFERNVLINSVWPFRDYVVRSFNDDKPFDRLVKEHLAGDVIAGGDPQTAIGTAFLVCGPYDNVGNQDANAAAVIRADALDEMVRATGEAFLGLTIGCARCHDHKFDPITAADYYALTATFAGVKHGERDLGNGPVWAGIFDAGAGPFHVFLGGDPQRKGDAVVPASLDVLQKSSSAYTLPADAPESQRRLALAEWIVAPDNPLTPRVLANRLWHYHFGTGLVDTPSDLGAMGGRPSHPKLLDWLASELLRQNWRLKPLHRLIVTSQTYRQSAAFRPEAAAIDADARLLWRFPPRRLSGEEVRDTMLAVAGRLDNRMSGPGFRLYQYVEDNVATYVPLDAHGPETYRRAIYHQNARAMRVDVLTDFDCPDPAFAAPRRPSTTTPLQSLALMNHSFPLDMAEAFAERLKINAGDDINEQIRHAFLVAFGRKPEPNEFDAAKTLIDTHGLRAFCRAVLNSNELVTVR